MKDLFTPRNQADCDFANALRDYEAAHAVWMNTSVFTEAGKQAKIAKDEARKRYEAAYKLAHPTHLILL